MKKSINFSNLIDQAKKVADNASNVVDDISKTVEDNVSKIVDDVSNVDVSVNVEVKNAPEETGTETTPNSAEVEKTATDDENPLVKAVQDVAKSYTKEDSFLVTEDGNVFLKKSSNSAVFHAKKKNIKLFVYNVADATLKAA